MRYRRLLLTILFTFICIVNGEWTAEENRSLIRAIKNVTEGKEVTGVYKKLPWKIIAEQIPTRSPKQCRDKWLVKLLSYLEYQSDRRSITLCVHVSYII